MLVLKTYLIGLAFLAAALVVNSTAKWLNLPSWYDFLAQPKLTLTSVLWLFVGYPLTLGLIVMFLKRFL